MNDTRTSSILLALLACTLGCTPVLLTSNSIGVGVFWGVESQAVQQGVHREAFEGVGLVLRKDGAFLGYQRLYCVEVVPAALQGTTRVEIPGWTIFVGDDAAQSLLHQRVFKQTGVEHAQ